MEKKIHRRTGANEVFMWTERADRGAGNTTADPIHSEMDPPFTMDSQRDYQHYPLCLK